MKTPAVKGLFAAVAAVVLAATPLVGRSVTLDVTKVQQRYPWNGLVDIDYTITLGEDETLDVDDNLEITMIDKSVSPAVTNRAICFLQAPLPLTAGSHRITWDANYDGVTNYTDNAEFIVKIAHYAPTYMVIDVSAGSGKDAEYHLDFLNGEPVGGFNTSEYKLDKIVLRRIHPGSYMAGSPTAEPGRYDNEAQHRVALSHPFYIGIFEVTQRQYECVVGSNPSTKKVDGKSPVTDVTWNTIAAGFLSFLSQRCRSKNADTGEYTEPMSKSTTGFFDMPTEFQWEYACRAGTTTPFNGADQTGTLEEQLARVGRYKGNADDGHGGIVHAIVGSYDPNAWGLYDMHGNVWEWCLDWYASDVAGLAQYVDPTGPASGSLVVVRGGSYGEEAKSCRSARRFALKGRNEGNYTDWGFRLSLTLPQ